MGVAVAVAAAEALDGRCSGHGREGAGPEVFKVKGGVTVPCFERMHDTAQVVDMPANGLFRSTMPPNARTDTAGAECAADIAVIARICDQHPPTSDRNSGSGIILENDDICS